MTRMLKEAGGFTSWPKKKFTVKFLDAEAAVEPLVVIAENEGVMSSICSFLVFQTAYAFTNRESHSSILTWSARKSL